MTRGFGARLKRQIRERLGKTQVTEDLKRLVGGCWRAAPAGAPRVGIAALASGDWHLVIEQLLAHALAARGADVEMLVCDVPTRPHCDERTCASRHRDVCTGCASAKRDLLDAGQVPWRGLSTCVAEDAVTRAKARIATLTDGELEHFSYRGWLLSRWIYVSACHYLQRDARADTPESIDARRRLLATGIVLIDGISAWLDRYKPDVVLVESGAHLEWRIAFELARARGLRVVCREQGKGGWDRHLFAVNRDAMSPDLDEAWRDARNRPLSDDESRQVDQILAQLPRATFEGGDRLDRLAPARLRDSLGIGRDARVIAAFTNVTWDLATAGRNAAFDGVQDWLRVTAASLGRSEIVLVVRAHPAATSVGMRDEFALPEDSRVRMIPADNRVAARDVFAMADLVVAYNSTVAIEAAAAGKPVVVCGHPHFRGRGFTIDIDSRDDYARLLAEAAGGVWPLPPNDAAVLARRYCHLFFARYTMTVNWTTSPLVPPYQLLLTSLDQLAPGRQASLDAICDGVLSGRQPLMAQVYS